MKNLCRRLVASALVVSASVGVVSAQQGRSQGRSRAAEAAGGVVTSVDADGVPRFVVATDSRSGPLGATHDGAARWHVGRFARALDVTPADVAATSTVAVNTFQTGDVIVELRQRFGGLDVVGSDVSVLMRGDHRLVAISGRPRSTSGAQTRFERSPQEALAAALSAQFGTDVSAFSIASVATARGEARFQVAFGTSLQMSEAAPVRPVLYPVGGRLVAAYSTDFYAGTVDATDSAAYRYVIDANSGRVLERRDLTVSEGRGHSHSSTPPAEFHYRVFAEPGNKRPLDGPQIDVSPHPTGNPDGTMPPFVAPNLVTMGGFNHPPSGPADPWLAPDATETIGNNADAYIDLSAPDGFTPGVDFRADLTASAHLRSHLRHVDRTGRDHRSAEGGDHERVLHGELAARLLVRLGLRRGRRQRAARQLRPRRRRGRPDARRSAGQLPRRLAQQRQHGHAGRRHPPRMQMFTWFGAAGRDADVDARRQRSRPARRRSGRRTSTSPRRSCSPTTALAPSTSDACEPLTGAAPAGSCSSIAAPAPSRSRQRNAQAAGAVGHDHRQQRSPAPRRRTGRHRSARHDRRPLDHARQTAWR